MLRVARSTLAATLLALTLPLRGITGQGAASEGKVTVGAGAGWTFAPARGFANDQLCPSSQAQSFALDVGYRLAKRVIAQGVLALHTSLGTEQRCVSSVDRPYTYQYTESDERYVGYPFGSAALRLAAEPIVAKRFRGRLLVGGGAVSKGVPFALAGAQLLVGGGPLRGRLEAEHWWYSIPERHVTVNPLDAPLRWRDVRSTSVAERTTFVRAGVEVSFPARRR